MEGEEPPRAERTSAVGAEKAERSPSEVAPVEACNARRATNIVARVCERARGRGRARKIAFKGQD